jgi:uncharacterized membrane protein YkvA (DUF1232 family)
MKGLPLRTIGRSLKARLEYYRAIYRHPCTPRVSKWLLWIALAYVMMPFDLIPDFIPVVGHLDDLVIVPALIVAAVRMVPDEVLSECAAQYLAIDEESGTGSGH